MAVRKLLPSRRGGTAPIRLRPVCWGRAVPPCSPLPAETVERAIFAEKKSG